MNIQQQIQAQWQKRGIWAWLMSPLALLVCIFAGVKRWAYQSGCLKQTKIAMPVIVVGNISVGGSGKTPLVIYLAKLLKDNGYQPGIICRGYKGKAPIWPQAVSDKSCVEQVGDEAVLLAKSAQCPVMAGPVRAQAAQQLINESHCDVILSDDGYQHLKLARDIDVVVVDSKRGLGNGWCLPSGPLRERQSALQKANFIVHHGLNEDTTNDYAMHLSSGELETLDGGVVNSNNIIKQPVHAVTGIGHPQRFFDTLRALGFNILEHAFADHHAYTAQDINFKDDHVIITTAKDAVKLMKYDTRSAIYVLPVQAQLTQQFNAAFLQKLNKFNA